MTDITSPLPDIRSGRQNLLPVKLALALGFAALADWLFWHQRIGLSMALFAVALLAGSYLANFRTVNRRRSITAAIVLLIALVPAVEELNGLSSPFVIAGLITSVAVLTNPDFSRLSDGVRACRDLLLIGPFRLIGDVAHMTDIRALSTGLTRWFVPLLFGSIFLFLFASANPLIEKWVRLLDIREWSANSTWPAPCSGCSCCRWPGRSFTCAGAAGRNITPPRPRRSPTTPNRRPIF